MGLAERDNAQSERFKQAALELGTNDDPDAFDALFSKLVPAIVPQPEKTIAEADVKDGGRIPEKTIAAEALRLLAQAPDGFMTTSDLIPALEKQFEPTGDDAEILEGRSDTKFSQKVRNLVSHRGDGRGLETNGFAVYDKGRRGWTITQKGRDQA